MGLVHVHVYNVFDFVLRNSFQLIFQLGLFKSEAIPLRANNSDHDGVGIFELLPKKLNLKNFLFHRQKMIALNFFLGIPLGLEIWKFGIRDPAY